MPPYTPQPTLDAAAEDKATANQSTGRSLTIPPDSGPANCTVESPGELHLAVETCYATCAELKEFLVKHFRDSYNVRLKHDIYYIALKGPNANRQSLEWLIPAHIKYTIEHKEPNQHGSQTCQRWE